MVISDFNPVQRAECDYSLSTTILVTVMNAYHCALIIFILSGKTHYIGNCISHLLCDKSCFQFPSLSWTCTIRQWPQFCLEQQQFSYWGPQYFLPIDLIHGFTLYTTHHAKNILHFGWNLIFAIQIPHCIIFCCCFQHVLSTWKMFDRLLSNSSKPALKEKGLVIFCIFNKNKQENFLISLPHFSVCNRFVPTEEYNITASLKNFLRHSWALGILANITQTDVL